jgi:hypothetical protein
MNDVPRQKLCEIIIQYGYSVCEDPTRLEGLLRDFCGQFRSEISVLISALKERVPADLLSSQNSVPQEVLLPRLTNRLQDNLGLTEDAARWAVDSWALALGIISHPRGKNVLPNSQPMPQQLTNPQIISNDSQYGAKKSEHTDFWKRVAVPFFLIAVFASFLGTLVWQTYQQSETIRQTALDKEAELADAKARAAAANEAEYKAKKEAAQVQIEAAKLQAIQQKERMIQNDSNSINLDKDILKEEYVDGYKLIYLIGLDKGGFKNYIDPESIKIDGTNIQWIAIGIPNSSNKVTYPRYRSIREADCAGDQNQITMTEKKISVQADYSYLRGEKNLSDLIAEKEKSIVCSLARLN